MTDDERKAASLNLDMELAQAQENNEASEQEQPKHFGGNVTGQELPLNTSIMDWLFNTASQYSGIAGGDENAQILALENHYAQTRAYIDYMYALRRNENPPLPAFHSINTPDTKLSIFVNGKIIEPSFVARFLDERQITIAAKGMIYSGETELTRRDLINLIKTDISIYVTDGTYKKAKELAEAVIGAAPHKKVEFSGGKTIEQLRENPPPPKEFIVPKFMPVGLNFIAGSPKAGKSLLCLQLSDAVATGGLFLDMPAKQGDVLYMAMEENAEDFYAKIEKTQARMQHNFTFVPPGEATVTINNGLTEYLDGWRRSVSNPKLVVIDTLADVKDPVRPGLSVYESDGQTFGKLQRYANDAGLCIVLVTHLKKQDGRFKPDDPFDSVQGSKGLAGKVDGQFMLTGLGQDKKLFVKGRSMPQIALDLFLDDKTCIFSKCGMKTQEEIKEQREMNEYLDNPIALTVRQMLAKNGRWVAAPDDIWEETINCTRRNPSSSKRQMGIDIDNIQSKLLTVHGITVRSNHTNKGTVYIFEYERKDT